MSPAARSSSFQLYCPSKEENPLKREAQVFLKKDCPIVRLRPLKNAVTLSRQGVLIFPNGLLQAQVKIPRGLQNRFIIHPHSRSTFARLGIEVTLTQREFNKKDHRGLVILLWNWGEYPFLMRSGDTVALSNFLDAACDPKDLRSESWRKTCPGRRIDLTLDGQGAEVNPMGLPTITIPGKGSFHFIDPRRDPKTFTRVHRFRHMHLRKGRLAVVATRESIRIPVQHFGIVHSAPRELDHSSAMLAYPEWEGRLALELRALEDTVLKPGQRLGFLTIHKLANHPAAYRGRYQKQTHPAPQ